MTQWWTLATDGLKLRPLRQTGTHPRHQPWLKPSPQSSSLAMSKLSCCGSSWPTLLVVAMGQKMLPLQLRPPTVTSRLLIRRPSLKQESLSKPITGFVQSSPSLGSYVARRCKRLSLPPSSCVVTLAHGGPTTPPLAPRTIRCRGLSSVVPSAPTTFQQTWWEESAKS
jgi:hypothetical protein